MKAKKSLSFALFMMIVAAAAHYPVWAEDLVYVAVNPCRIVDTRIAGGAIPANNFRNFRASGTVGQLAVQGGTTNCLDPKAGTGVKPLAITAYVLAVPAPGSNNGVLTAYPSNLPPPPAGSGSTVNFAAGQVIGNTTTITLCDPAGSCPTNGELAILARNTNQHVVIDVQGYFYPQSVVNTVILETAYDYGVSFGSCCSEVAVVTCPSGSILTGGGVNCDTLNANYDTTNFGVVSGGSPTGNSYMGLCFTEALSYSSSLLAPPITAYAVCAYSTSAVSAQTATASVAALQAASLDAGGQAQQGEPSAEALLTIESLKNKAAAMESRINGK